MLRQISILTLLGAVILPVAGPMPASAADLPSYGRAYSNAYRSPRLERSVAVPFASLVRCPRQEPADYRPRLIGEPDCSAARPYGPSPTLYGPRIGTEWGVDY